MLSDKRHQLSLLERFFTSFKRTFNILCLARAGWRRPPTSPSQTQRLQSAVIGSVVNLPAVAMKSHHFNPTTRIVFIKERLFLLTFLLFWILPHLPAPDYPAITVGLLLFPAPACFRRSYTKNRFFEQYQNLPLSQ